MDVMCLGIFDGKGKLSRCVGGFRGPGFTLLQSILDCPHSVLRRTVMCLGKFDGMGKLNRQDRQGLRVCFVPYSTQHAGTAVVPADAHCWQSPSSACVRQMLQRSSALPHRLDAADMSVCFFQYQAPFIDGFVFCCCRKEVLLRDSGEPGGWEWPDGATATEPPLMPDGR